MKQLIALIAILFSTHLFAEQIARLKIKQPHWQFQKTESYEDGSPKTLVYYDQDKIVKKITYRFDGSLETEADVNGLKDGQLLFDGPTIAYFADGMVEKVTLYVNGEIRGSVKHYHPNGLVRYEYCVQQGHKHGKWLSYFSSGNIKEEGFYRQGKPEGEYRSFYSNGSKAMEASYHNGLVHGEVKEWHENGSLKATAYYINGLLHHDRGSVALRRYYEDGSLQEEQDFLYGQPFGKHFKYYPNGQKSYSVAYSKGKKQGLESYFSETGESLGGGKYSNGIPAGEHIRKAADGTVVYRAKYDQNGNLLEPVREYDLAGNKTLQYLVDDHGYIGEFLEWHPNGVVKRRYHYDQGVLDGVQEEFYASKAPKLRVTYSGGKKEGNYEEWFADGNKKCTAFYEKGVIHGMLHEWFENQRPKLCEEYHLGKRNGSSKEWDQNGILVFEATFQNDQLNGEVKEWHPNGKLKGLYVCENGKLNGPWTKWFDDGNVHEERSYSLGVPQGTHRTYYPLREGSTSCILEKEWSYRDGKLDGQQKRFYRNGSKEAILSYEQGVLNGKKILWDSHGNILEEANYVAGNLEGRYFRLTNSGRELIYHYKDNRLHGLHQIYYPENQICGKVKALEGNFVDGFLEGEVSEFNEVGTKIISTPYVKGKKEGIATVYNHEGKARLSVSFKNDTQDGISYEFSNNGKIIREINYVADKKQGEEKSFFEDGTLAALKTFKDDLLDGYWKEWNGYGILIYEGQFKAGERHGTIKKFDDEGKLILLQVYENDVLKEKQAL